jgi:hypothetical protein
MISEQGFRKIGFFYSTGTIFIISFLSDLPQCTTSI